MRLEFEMPCYVETNGLQVETHEMTCAVELESDEHSGVPAYYIARVFIEGTTKVVDGSTRHSKRGWHEIYDKQPLFPKIALHAYTYHKDELEELWDEYLSELPKSRRPTTDREEHGTYGARP